MQAKGEKKNRLREELKIVPPWAWILAAIGFLSAPLIFTLVLGQDTDAPSAPARAALGLAAAIVLGCYVALLGYVNRDARRRGMSPLLWTLLVIFIPNGFGFLLYFILRTPRRSSCPRCGKAVQEDFDFCPGCSYRIRPGCPQCQRTLGPNLVNAEAGYCPYCGFSLRGQAASPSSAKVSV